MHRAVDSYLQFEQIRKVREDTVRESHQAAIDQIPVMRTVTHTIIHGQVNSPTEEREADDLRVQARFISSR